MSSLKLSIKNRASIANVTEEKPKSEYWCNLVYVFDEVNPETKKPYYITIPGCYFTLDNICELADKAAPKIGANKDNVINIMRAQLPEIADMLLEFAKAIPVGERELAFLLDRTDSEGNAVTTGFAIEIYHCDTSGAKMTVESGFKVRKLV